MSKKTINRLLRETFEQQASKREDQIIRAAGSKNDAPTVSVVQEASHERIIRRGIAAAVAAAMIFGLIAVTVRIYQNKTCATVTVESSICVEISLNRAGKPTGLRAVGSSAEPLVRRIETGHTLDASVDNILDGMLEDSNLSESSNTVLITADAAENADEWLSAAFKAAKDSFAQSGYQGAILTVVASDDADIRRIASRHHISYGKAYLVSEIHRKENRFGVDMLCRLSINDLNLLTAYRRIHCENVGIYGTSHERLSVKEAVALAAHSAGTPEESVSATVDVSLSGLVYCLTVHGSDQTYHYYMSAESGEILSSSQESLPVLPTAPEHSEAPADPAEPSVIPSDTPTRAASDEPVAPAESLPPKPTASAPTAPQPTAPAPTEPPTRPQPAEPAAFTAADYLRSDDQPTADRPGENARRLSITRIVNSYDVWYDHTDFPYSPADRQGGITALVCSREQFVRLTGREDERFGDSFFKTHALYIHMNRDVSYHWIKSVQNAYMDGGTLFLACGEPVGYYITSDDEHPARIYTVVYELNKAELYDLVKVKEYAE